MERCLIQKALLRKQKGSIKFFAIVTQRRIQNPVKHLRGLFREMLSLMFGRVLNTPLLYTALKLTEKYLILITTTIDNANITVGATATIKRFHSQLQWHCIGSIFSYCHSYTMIIKKSPKAL